MIATAAILATAAKLYDGDLRAAIRLAAGDYAGAVAARGALCGFLGLPCRGYAENGQTLLTWAAGRSAAEVVDVLRAAGERLAERDRGEIEPPTATLHHGDATWHDGPGWYYTDDEYPDEGSCGSFETAAAAIAHAEAAGYTVGPDARPGSIEATSSLGFRGAP